ncbi:natural product precursor [Kordia periserrulae]|uniref:Natural product n=1 Tax=Kordia periserrulae TaxID=701523 RepID=A0A2T6C2Z8_9FLAO|nr:TIGR04149 family rSAM-modified RiPP [Kordia periserrulae]PTX62700.1 natural product precursor [Kordia periserrulae]
MKKQKINKLKLSKKSISVLQKLELKEIKGGTEPVSAPMSQAPDDQTICYQLQ